MAKDPWEDLLADVKGTLVSGGEEERIATKDILRLQLSLQADKQNDVAAKRVKAAMIKLGWQGPKKMKFTTGGGGAGASLWGYWRPARQ